MLKKTWKSGTIRPIDVLLFEYFNKSFWKKIENEGENFYQELTIFRQKAWEIKWGCVTNGTRLQTIYKGKQAKGYVIRNDFPGELLAVCQKLITSEIDYLEHLRVKQRQRNSHRTQTRRQGFKGTSQRPCLWTCWTCLNTSRNTQAQLHVFSRMVKFQDGRFPSVKFVFGES